MGTKPAHLLSGGVRTPDGLLLWSWDRDAAVGGPYRIRNVAPFRWELTFRDRPVSEHRRLSIAQMAAELHHRRTLRRTGMVRWGTLVAVGLAVALAFMGVAGPSGILGTLGGLCVCLAGVPRFIAALTGNLLDPYRRRDPWEPPDWWNRNP
jgi:hypothetical protein